MKLKMKEILKTGSEAGGKKMLTLHCAILLVLVVAVFWQYLAGMKYYVFTDIASDSAGQTYPSLVYLAREVRAGNTGNRWNFVNSIGNAADTILPRLINAEIYLGEEHVAYMMGLCMAVKVYLSGLFFYLYLRKMGISGHTSSLFAIFYAFGANMVVRGAWWSYPSEVLSFAVWLYAFESWFRNRKNWWGLVLASAFFFFNNSGYYIALYVGIFTAYAIFRALDGGDMKCGWKKASQCLVFAGTVVCALLLSSAGWLDSMTTQLKSDRLSNGVQKLDSYGTSSLFTDAAVLKTAFYRTIGTDILGINYDYCGTGNFLEAPTFYCGILTLLVLPAVVLSARGLRKAAYCAGLSGAVLYIFVKPVRFLANGLSGHTFKLASLWVMVLMLYMAASGFDGLLESRGRVKLRPVFVTGVVIVALAVLLRIDGMNYARLGTAAGLMLCYMAALCHYGRGNMTETGIKALMLAIASVEVLSVSYGCINKRGTMDANVYEDGTMAALGFLEDRKGGTEDFFRVDKQFESFSFCDSLYQGYMGTTAYIGGSGDRKSTGDFYEALAMPIFGGNNHSMAGFSSSTSVNTLMNVRYILSRTGMNTNFGYEKLGETDGVTIYENRYALPLGYVYDRYMALDEYLKLPVETRRRTLLEMCVLDSEDDGAGLTKGMPETDMPDIRQYEVSSGLEITDNWVEIALPKSDEGDLNLVVMSVECNGYKSSMAECYNSAGETTSMYLGFADGSEDYFLEINDTRIERIQIFNTKQYEIGRIQVYQIPQGTYYMDYMDQCTELGRSGLRVERMDSNNIWGAINSGKDGMMTFSIPYDRNWHVYIDGEEQGLVPVNIAMMGTRVTKGRHEVKLVYYKENVSVKYMLAGAALFVFASGISLIGNRRGVG